MLADVPLGAFLSGGIDSSLIVAAMQEQASRPVKTFTIGFEEEAYDESSHARAVASHLGTEHTEMLLSVRDALELVPGLPDFYDEPFADSSQLPTLLVSKAARAHVTVALTGDAGDEVFGGYNRHVIAARYGRFLESTPEFVRSAFGAALAGPARSEQLERLLRSVGLGNNVRKLGEKAGKAAAMFRRGGDRAALYRSLVRRDDDLLPGAVVSGAVSDRHAEVSKAKLDMPDYMMLMDTLTYMLGDILTKVDRASMAVALETRAPYLDHHLFELAWQLPVSEHIRDGRSKIVLREMLAKRVPVNLFERPKAGFGVPISQWLRGPLKNWLYAAANDFCMASPRHRLAVEAALQRLEAGSPTIHHFLWNVAMLQSWRKRHLPADAAMLHDRAVSAA